ncbi:MAG: hypothetical protein ACLFPH_08045 [Bacteroidales bacterium]
MNNKPEVFFHVGLERTATTFLQKRIFPYLKDIHHVTRKEYNNYEKIIAETNHKKYLISNEISNDKLENELNKISLRFPNAKIILVMRRQDKWIASQYKRAVKNGLPHRLNKFLDIDNDQGKWKKKHLYFFRFIEIIEKKFHNSPLILFHHQLKEEPVEFVRRLLDYLGTETPLEDLSLKPTHVSYSKKQLIIKRWISKRGLFKEPKTSSKTGINYFLRIYKKIFRYLILNVATLIPEKVIKEKELINEKELQRIQKYFEEDWNKCLNYEQ